MGTPSRCARGLSPRPARDHPGVESFTAGDVDHRLGGWITDEPHRRESLDRSARRLLLSAFGIVIRRHVRRRLTVETLARQPTLSRLYLRGGVDDAAPVFPRSWDRPNRDVALSCPNVQSSLARCAAVTDAHSVNAQRAPQRIIGCLVSQSSNCLQRVLPPGPSHSTYFAATRRFPG